MQNINQKINRKDIILIDNKIAYYNFELSKIGRITRKGGVKISKKPHLKNFYLDEIGKLEVEKERILSRGPEYVIVDFGMIRFEDHQVRIKMGNGKISQPFFLNESRKSFELLKEYIDRCELNSLKIILLDDKILSIQNLQELNSIIKILTVQDIIHNELISANNIIEIMETVDNDFIIRFFGVKDKSIYFKYLCNIQSLSHKIIPVIETTTKNEKNNLQGDGFLFSVKGSDNLLYIIWESTSINRATYIFKTNSEDYMKCIQKIFDFISSDQHAKRMKIRSSIKKTDNTLNAVKFLEHDNLATWSKYIDSIGQ